MLTQVRFVLKPRLGGHTTTQQSELAEDSRSQPVGTVAEKVLPHGLDRDCQCLLVNNVHLLADMQAADE